MAISFTPNVVEQLFGHEAAENDKKLKSYFYKSSLYEQVRSNSPLKILTGFKGTGKSALMTISYLEDLDNGQMALWIKPDDLSELYDQLRDVSFVRAITLWKAELAKVIVDKIIEEYIPDYYEECAGVGSWAKQIGYKNSEFLTHLIRKLEDKLKETLANSTLKDEKKKVINSFLKNLTINVYIDDLDRGWTCSENDKTRLSSLINALRDMTSAISGLKARISFRTDVYWAVRSSNESQDKFEASEVWVNWTNHEIGIMIAKRITTFLGTQFNEKDLMNSSFGEIAPLLNPVFEDRFRNTTNWNNKETYRVLMSLIRKRPRDLIKLCTFSANQAYAEGASLILGKHVTAILPDYSRGRLQDLINEFRTEEKSIEDLLYKMAPTTKELADPKIENVYKFTTDRLITKIKNVKQNIDIDLEPMEIARFLYKIGFLTARKTLNNNFVERKYWDEKRELLKDRIGDLGYGWEIHPSYRSALGRDGFFDWWLTVDLI
ncbi:hypothetical protein HM1_2015 [Heliomicrobium modesticaldum Ice1]|uniref:Uncharacterized protein n=1 Tax=Heliobacterium modesticaldum (strain ATCC 51547 / Ice1) TaxID=498761 RepID=B0TG76_HELMI|nr:hypothetical protein [Heliomicrobium modesticaldum]ABZ84572.1 hypothetical protein HM1_2015 [Heliomicrobium modesticaldum Ice1]